MALIRSRGYDRSAPPLTVPTDDDTDDIGGPDGYVPSAMPVDIVGRRFDAAHYVPTGLTTEERRHAGLLGARKARTEGVVWCRRCDAYGATADAVRCADDCTGADIVGIRLDAALDGPRATDAAKWTVRAALHGTGAQAATDTTPGLIADGRHRARTTAARHDGGAVTVGRLSVLAQGHAPTSATALRTDAARLTATADRYTADAARLTGTDAATARRHAAAMRLAAARAIGAAADADRAAAMRRRQDIGSPVWAIGKPVTATGAPSKGGRANGRRRSRAAIIAATAAPAPTTAAETVAAAAEMVAADLIG